MPNIDEAQFDEILASQMQHIDQGKPFILITIEQTLQRGNRIEQLGMLNMALDSLRTKNHFEVVDMILRSKAEAAAIKEDIIKQAIDVVVEAPDEVVHPFAAKKRSKSYVRGLPRKRKREIPVKV